MASTVLFLSWDKDKPHFMPWLICWHSILMILQETLVKKIDEKVDPVEQRLVPIEATIRSINYECEFTPCKVSHVFPFMF